MKTNHTFVLCPSVSLCCWLTRCCLALNIWFSTKTILVSGTRLSTNRLLRNTVRPERPQNAGPEPVLTKTPTAGQHKHKQSDASQPLRNTVERFCLRVFERSFISRRFSSLSVVQWACCHQINETLWAAVPELNTHTRAHTHFLHVTAPIVCLCCCVVLLLSGLIKLELAEAKDV